MMCSATIATDLTLVTQDAFVVSEIWWRLLKTIVVAKGSLYLMHV
tara:strand:+ start:738 stop:872 length:135 start_codon:yes stop_codon:yes gene_type:complete